MLGDGEVEEGIETAHGEVFEEAKEVDADGREGGEGNDAAADVGGGGQRFVDDREGAVRVADWGVELGLLARIGWVSGI